MNTNAGESDRTMEPTSLALQREVAPPSSIAYRVLADLLLWRQEQLEMFFMGSFYEAGCTLSLHLKLTPLKVRFLEKWFTALSVVKTI